MANKYHGQVGAISQVQSGRSGKAGAAASMTEKVGFPGAQLPGKPQSKKRNAGVHHCKVTADSKGI